MKYRFATLIITTLILYSCKKSQNNPHPDNGDGKEQWQFFNTTNSKLPANQINTMAVSKNNIKWIGTANGLLSINGDAWVVYKAQNGGLPSSNILSLAVQANGNVWVGTDKGLAKFDGNTWTSYVLTNSTLPDQAIMSLVCDDQHGRVWVGTSKGIVEIDSDNRWTLHDETENILPLSMTVDQSGALWIGAHDPFSFRGSIKKFNNGLWKSYALDQMGYESAFPYAIAVEKDNAVVAVLSGTVTRAVIKFTNSTWT